jgi:ribonuclease P protein component
MDQEIRLRKSADFETVYNDGRSVGNRLLVLFFRRTPGSATRVGLSVSKRVGNSVTRNLVKRRLRAIINSEKGNIAAGVDIVIIAKPGAATIEFSSLRDSLVYLLKRAGLREVKA